MILGAKRLVVTIYIQYHLCLKYEFALVRVKELLPLVDDNIPANDKNAVDSLLCPTSLLRMGKNIIR